MATVGLPAADWENDPVSWLRKLNSWGIFLSSRRFVCMVLRPSRSSQPFMRSSRSQASHGSKLSVSREAPQRAVVTLMLVFDPPFFRSAAPAESARLMLYSGSQSVCLRDPELSAVQASATTAVNFPPMIG